MHSVSNDKTRVLLVYPRLRLPTGDPPLGLAYIASSLIASGHAEVRIADATFQPSLKYVISAIQQFDPDIVGIFVDTMMYNDAVAIALAVKELGKFVITGGPHATVMPESLSTVSDIIVLGEGEQAMVDIVERFADKAFESIPGIWFKDGEATIKTTPRTTFVDLDSLPIPATELLDMRSYLSRWHYLDCLDVGLKGTNLIGSRGCPFNCTYCQPTLRTMFGNKIRFRSAESIISEIHYLKDRYNISSFFFHDDTFTADRDRLLSTCESILRSNLKILWGCNTRVDTIDREMMKVMQAAGLRKLHVGAESGNQRILDEMYGKNISLEQVRNTIELAKEASVHCLCFFILGAPSETRQEIRNTIDFACSLPIEEATFSILTPLPGSDIRKRITDDSQYTLSNDFSDYNYYSSRAFSDPLLSNDHLKFQQMWALIRFYTHSGRLRYLLSHLKSADGLRKLLRKITRSL